MVMRAWQWLTRVLASLQLLRWVLLADFVTLTATAVIDIFLYHWQDISGFVTVLLRISVGVVNAAAVADVGRELKRLGSLSSYGVHLSYPKPWELPSVVAGQAAASPVLLVPLWIEGRSEVHDPWDIVVVVIASLLLAFALGVTLGAVIERPHVALNRGWVAVIALLPLAGLFQFWYQAFYKPAHERPTVNVRSKLYQVGRHGGVTHMGAAVTLENVGAAAVDVLGSMYTITSHGMRPVDHTMTASEVSSAMGLPWRPPWKDEISYRGLIKAGPVMGAGGQLTPGQKTISSFAFDVPNDAQEKLRLTVHLSLLTHGSVLGKFKPCASHFSEPNSSTCFEVAMLPHSWIASVLGDTPVARAIVFDPLDRPPYLETEFDGIGPNERRGATSSVEYRLDP